MISRVKKKCSFNGRFQALPPLKPRGKSEGEEKKIEPITEDKKNEPITEEKKIEPTTEDKKIEQNADDKNIDLIDEKKV